MRHMLSQVAYEGWETTATHSAQRSFLYSLPPFGIGTPAVESLTGYIARLAAAHAVEEAAPFVSADDLARRANLRGSPGQPRVVTPSSVYKGLVGRVYS